MKNDLIISLDNPEATLDRVGGKGASLARLARAGLPVPGGFYVTTTAYHQFVKENNLQPAMDRVLEGVDYTTSTDLDRASKMIRDLMTAAPIPQNIMTAVGDTYETTLGGSTPVAVRSSATAEDLPQASFAGQQETFLNVQGREAILEALRECWASLWTARAIDYRRQQKIDSRNVALAVVVQCLFPAEAAGIMFTAHPVSGRRDRILISASWGLGEAVVAGQVTPDNLTIEKPSLRIVERETAVKLVRTARTQEGVENQPVAENQQRLPVLSDSQTEALARLGLTIEEIYNIPMDIEWAWADGEFAILQARPITALPTPEPTVPSEWRLPPGAYAAMRNNIVELMADPLSPLFATFGLNAVNTSMERMMADFMGDSGIMPDSPIITVNQYAYYNGSVSAKSMLKIFFNAIGILKRMFTGAVERWTETGRPQYTQIVAAWEKADWRELPAKEILQAAHELTIAAIDAYGALVSGVIPAAWISEALFTMVYKLVKGREDPPAATYLLGYDSLPIKAEKDLYDLATWTRLTPGLVSYLNGAPADELAERITDHITPTGVEEVLWYAWLDKITTHLKTYGFAIYNLDFIHPTPADDPAPVLETFKMFLSGQGVNPHTRQQNAAERRELATQSMEKRLKGFRLSLFQKNLARAQKYAPLREDGLAEIGLSYPLVRKMLLEVGKRFSDNGMIENPEDIFWLEVDEVHEAAARLDENLTGENFSMLVPERQAAWRSARRAAPPLMLPQIRIFGRDLAEMKAKRGRKISAESLKGVAASPGSLTGPASVIHGPEDFASMAVGDVLVAPLTTPAWTPLFARAGAVVTDIGGPLSHGSIVAREYGIPAVLGTGEATKRIRSGQIITVDGDSGMVILNEPNSTRT